MAGDNDPLENTRESSNRTSRSIDRLGAAADRAARMAGIFGEMPDSLTDLIGTTNAATRGLAYFESRFQVLQQLTSFGATFGYSLQEMELSANSAGLSLTDLANVVAEQSEHMAMLGTDMDSGLTNFLNRQASLFSRSEENVNQFGMTMNEQFRALGLTQDQITKTATDFENMYQMGRVADFRNNQHRNQQMMEYFEVLDDLSRLTGKQRDQIADELAENARRGQVQARAMMIEDDELRQEYRNQLGGMRSILGDQLGGLAEDILGPGSPQSRAAADLSVAASDYTNTLYQARAALDRGDMGAFTELMNQAKVAAMGARNQNNAQMVMYRQMNEYGNNVGIMFEETYAVANQFERMRSELEQELGRNVTDLEVFTRMQERFAEQRANRQERFANRDDVFGSLAGLSSDVQNQGMAARQTAINTAYESLTGILNGISSAFNQLNLPALFRGFEADIRAFRTGLFGGETTELSSQIESMRQMALGLGDDGVLLATQLSEVQNNLANNNLPASDRAAEEQRARDLMQAIRDLERVRVMNADNVEITQADIVNINNLREALGLDPIEPPDSTQSIGTLGNTGRLFKDFGQETMTALHGLEAVLTPDQLGHVVQRTVSGALQGAAPTFAAASNTSISMPAELTNGIRSIDGRLNTLRNLPQMMANNNGQTVDITPLEQAIMNLPASIKRPFEEALASTVGSEIANNTKMLGEIAYNTDRTNKNTKGISNDYLRGA